MVCSLISAAKQLNLQEAYQHFEWITIYHRSGFLLHYIMVRHEATSCAKFDSQCGLFYRLLTLYTILPREMGQTIAARHAVKPQRH